MRECRHPVVRREGHDPVVRSRYRFLRLVERFVSRPGRSEEREAPPPYGVVCGECQGRGASAGIPSEVEAIEP